MSTTTITLRVDSELAARATPSTALMDDLSDKAEARGLTAEKLEEMLNAR